MIFDLIVSARYIMLALEKFMAHQATCRTPSFIIVIKEFNILIHCCMLI